MTQQHCSACHAGMPILSAEQIQQSLAEVSGWEYNTEKNCISRTFEFKGFYKTMAMTNAIAWIAHAEKHHPDMQVSYNRLTVTYQTHEAGGVTENDIICAKLVNALQAES